MKRYTISIEDELAERFEAWSERHGYENRSEAIRDLLRDRLASEILEADKNRPCVASVSYVYDHHERDLGKRLTDRQHGHHDLTISTLHVHLDHSQCMEIAVLRGPSGKVVAEAQALIAERGVHHGNVHTVALPSPTYTHVHDHAHGHSHPHEH